MVITLKGCMKGMLWRKNEGSTRKQEGCWGWEAVFVSQNPPIIGTQLRSKLLGEVAPIQGRMML